MNVEFTRAFIKFAVVVSIAAGLLLILLGAAVLLFPQLVLQISLYIIGGAMLIAGLLFVGGTVRALLKS